VSIHTPQFAATFPALTQGKCTKMYKTSCH